MELFAGTAGGNEEFDYICEFGFYASGGTSYLLPNEFAWFGAHPYRVISSLDRQVTAGFAVNEFSFYLPGVKQAMLYDGKNQHPLAEAPGSIFSASLAVPARAGEVILYVVREDDQEESYHGLVGFPVAR